MEFLEKLKQLWTGLQYWTDSFVPGTSGAKPQVRNFHILWPWSVDMLRALAPSLFCDATFKVRESGLLGAVAARECVGSAGRLSCACDPRDGDTPITLTLTVAGPRTTEQCPPLGTVIQAGQHSDPRTTDSDTNTRQQAK